MRILVLIFLLICITPNPSKSQRTDSLLQIIAKGNRDVEEVKALTALAGEYMRKDLAKAKAYQLNAIALCKSIKSDYQLSSGYSQMVTILHNTGNTDSAAFYLGILKELAQKSAGEDKNRIQDNYYSTAGLYYKKTGNLKQAISFLNKAISLEMIKVNKIDMAGTLINLGNTYNLLGDYKSAMENHLKALKIFEEKNHLQGQSFCYQNICNSLIELKQFENALIYARKSIQIKKDLNDTRGIGTAETGLGQIYLGLQKPEEALLHFKTALNIADNLKLVTEQGVINFNLAKVYLVKKDTPSAIIYFNESRQLAIKLADSASVSAVDVELVALRAKKQEKRDAEKIMFNSIEKIKDAGQLPKEAAGYQNIAEYYASNKQFDKALIYTKKYYEFTDSLNNNELQMQIKNIEEQYDLDKKEKEISILKKDQLLNQANIEKQKVFQSAALIVIALIVLIAFLLINRYRTVQKSRQLLEMEKMRNNISSELHDDLGTKLTNINILSTLTIQAIDEPEKAKELLGRISSEVQTSADALDDIVWNINTKNDSLHEIIPRMRRYATEVLADKKVQFDVKVPENIEHLKFSMEKRHDVYLMFSEMVTNIYKHANASEVAIEVGTKDSAFYLHVRDNGQGFEKEKPTDRNGLQNLKMRTEKWKGRLVINSEKQKGTDILIELPVKNSLK